MNKLTSLGATLVRNCVTDWIKGPKCRATIVAKKSSRLQPCTMPMLLCLPLLASAWFASNSRFQTPAAMVSSYPPSMQDQYAVQFKPQFYHLMLNSMQYAQLFRGWGPGAAQNPKQYFCIHNQRESQLYLSFAAHKTPRKLRFAQSEFRRANICRLLPVRAFAFAFASQRCCCLRRAA